LGEKPTRPLATSVRGGEAMSVALSTARRALVVETLTRAPDDSNARSGYSLI
jgi:hypothetical protein